MDASYQKKVTDWISTFGRAPEDRSEVYTQAQMSGSSEFLPCGRFFFEVPEELREIVENWILESSQLHEKSIYMNDHYAFVAKRFEEGNIVEFIGTFRE